MLGWAPALPTHSDPVQAPLTSLYTFTHAAMATTFTLNLYDTDSSHAADVSADVFEEVDRLEQLLSNYRDSSELSRINREATRQAVLVEPEMLEFLEQSIHWSQVSDGAFDITVGPLMKTWGFYRHQGVVPPPETLEQLRNIIGWRNLLVDPATRSVRLALAGVELDPGGIGKGFAVDAAVRVLRAEGVHTALLSAGGSTLYGLGAPPGHRGWRVLVPGPLPDRRTLSTILLHNESLSSADCSQKSFVANGHRYCHIMDVRTMRPVEGRIQVSVIHPSATTSDALSNVVFVETPQQSLQTLAINAPQARVLIVSGVPRHATCSSFRWNAPIASRCASTNNGHAPRTQAHRQLTRTAP